MSRQFQGVANFGDNLTARQIQIVRLMTRCFCDKDIIAALRPSMSPYTLKHHLSRIFDKTGCDNRFHLLIWAFKHQIIKVDEIQLYGEEAVPSVSASEDANV